ncbi:outer membrane beta-barrel protein [Hymenobacter siberiensis]|uniref:outer membrane beta-barrel protein n=1 Tax=Hymenobacter siberiensis TaxID=2848396 RepID=UPI001C1DF1D2|nr:outer membrane beta-barrel protein [Hymenobacter siberiensis]
MSLKRLSTGKFLAGKVVVTLLVCHGTTFGQAPDSVARKGRWYAGIGAAYHSYYSINQPHSRIYPAYVSGGYFITSRVALQADVQYGQRTEESSGGESVINGEAFTFRNLEVTTSTALTLLARFSHRPQRPLQLEWLLGVAWVRGQVSTTITRTSATRSESFYYPDISATEPHVVGGLGLRYQLGPRLALGTEVLISKNLRIPPYGLLGLIPGGGAKVGLSYLFGPTKP